MFLGHDNNNINLVCFKWFKYNTVVGNIFNLVYLFPSDGKLKRKKQMFFCCNIIVQRNITK